MKDTIELKEHENMSVTLLQQVFRVSEVCNFNVNFNKSDKEIIKEHKELLNWIYNLKVSLDTLSKVKTMFEEYNKLTNGTK
jgi:hypothetical protein